MFESHKNEINTDRFILKVLEPNDASNKYLSWFDDNTAQKYIDAAKNDQSIKELQNFIKDKLISNDALFYGIFSKDSMNHIGNVKFEPISEELKTSVMGILIGEQDWRGKGVAKEVIYAVGKYLSNEWGINKMELGVAKENVAAINAYKKLGFEETSDALLISPSEYGIAMFKYFN